MCIFLYIINKLMSYRFVFKDVWGTVVLLNGCVFLCSDYQQKGSFAVKKFCATEV
jgi:hypothetical protein